MSSTRSELLRSISPLLGLKDGLDGATSAACLALHYAQQHRPVQSRLMRLATAMISIDATITAVDILYKSNALVDVLVKKSIGVYELIPGAVADAATCWAQLLDRLFPTGGPRAPSDDASGSDLTTVWIADSLAQAMLNVDSLADLAVLFGSAHLRFNSDSAFTTVDSIGHVGITIMPLGHLAAEVAVLRSGIARLFVGAANPVDSLLLTFQAERSDSLVLVTFCNGLGGRGKVTYGPFTVDSGGAGQPVWLGASRDERLYVDKNGDGAVDYIILANGEVVSAPPRHVAVSNGHHLRASPNPTLGPTTLRFSYSGGVGEWMA